MTSLKGLPDFQYPLAPPSADSDVIMFAPFEAGSYSVLPRQVELAKDGDGRPRFQLQLIKHATGAGEESQYSVMSMSLAGAFAMDDALTAARAATPDALVKAAEIQNGFIRLYATTAAVSLPAEMTTPVPLGLAGQDFARWTMRLPLTVGELIAGALTANSIIFGARLEYALGGVASRVPVFVQFEPAKLIAALVQGKAGGQIALPDLLAAFTGPSGALPYVIVAGTIPDPQIFGQAMTDRLIAAYGSFVPAPMIEGPPYIAFQPPPDPVATTTLQWDLAQPVFTTRQWATLLDPLTALQTAAKANGADSLVKNLVIPPLALGFLRIDLAANLPAPRVGVPAIGVTLSIPANPPERPQAQSTTVLLTPPDDRGSATFRLAPGEPAAYEIGAFAMIAAGRGIRRYESPRKTMTAAWIELQPADFPVRFAHLTAEPRLLAAASVQGVLRYAIGGKGMEQPFTVTPLGVGLAIPPVPDATISLVASPSGAGTALTLSAVIATSIRLDFTSFAQYGPHAVQIECRMTVDDPPLFIEMLADARLDDASAAPAKFALTPGKPNGRWGYVAQSPFRAGYRFRVAATGSEPPKPWSDVRPPLATLSLDAKGSILES